MLAALMAAALDLSGTMVREIRFFSRSTPVPILLTRSPPSAPRRDGGYTEAMRDNAPDRPDARQYPQKPRNPPHCAPFPQFHPGVKSSIPITSVRSKGGGSSSGDRARAAAARPPYPAGVGSPTPAPRPERRSRFPLPGGWGSPFLRGQAACRRPLAQTA